MGVAALGASAVSAPFSTARAAGYPSRPITIICPWAAGGGTDAVARIVGSLLEEQAGVPINVVNRTGGSGVVGHSAIANAKPDGYTLGLLTVEIGMMHWEGLTELTYENYTPLGLFNEDPSGLQVAADSPWKTAKDLLEAVRSGPDGTYKASGTGQGGIWQLALAGMLQAAGIEPDKVRWVPSEGAAPGLQDLIAGGIDIVPCSLPEAKSLMDAGKVKSLAYMAEERNPAFPDVPTLKEATGIEFTMGAWRGFAGPKGLPKDVTDFLVPAFKKVYDSEDYKSFMGKRGYGMIYEPPAGFEKFMATHDAFFGKTMKSLGLAQ
jgi:tripartite-type tricarboxylate transporter receptor subunit TctC